jgi:hypothetical protein
MLRTTAALFGGISSPKRKTHRNANRDEASTASSVAKEKLVSAVSTLQRSVSKKFGEVSDSVTPAVSNIQKSVSRNVTVVSQSVTKGILSRGKSANSAAETTCATNTTTNHESIGTPEYPDVEMQEEDVIMEEDAEGDGEATISSNSLESKEEVLNPRNLLWIIILSMVVCIIIVFVALVCLFAVGGS